MGSGLASALVVTCAGCTFIPLPASSATPDAGAAQMIAFDAQSSSATSGTASLTWSHAVGPGLVGSLLVVGVDIEKTSGASVQTITYAGAPLVKAAAATGGAGVKAELWYLVGPAGGTGNVVVTFTRTLASDGAVGGAISFSGASATSPIAITAAGGGSGQPSTSVASVADAWVVDTIMIDNGDDATPVTVGQTARWNTAQGTKIRGASSTVAAAQPGSTTMTWMSHPDNWAQVVAEIEP